MKKIIIFIACLVLCGCDAVYKINIVDNEVTETIKITETDSSLFDKTNDAGWTLRDSFNAQVAHDDFYEEQYDYDIKEDSNKLELTGKGKTNIDLIENLSILNQCYVDFNINRIDDVIIIDTGNNFSCYDKYEYLDKIRIELTTNHKVYDNNAIEVNGNTYIWEFTKDSNHEISINLDLYETKNSINMRKVIIIAILVVLMGIFGLIMYNKNKKSNIV